eukprot:2159448-Prymnesium_polylepis.1
MAVEAMAAVARAGVRAAAVTAAAARVAEARMAEARLAEAMEARAAARAGEARVAACTCYHRPPRPPPLGYFRQSEHGSALAASLPMPPFKVHSSIPSTRLD